jgi:uncharacterized membrane protein YbaN (DUF454 family)
MRRLGLLAVGWVAVALGGLGIVVPGLPTTGFFVLAAACFARSSPRFEQWVLGLPKIGPLVRDHRAGLGMPRRAKVVAIAMMLTACSLSSLALGSLPLAGVVMGAGLVGTWYVGWRIPTRERMVPAGPRAEAGAAAATGDEAQPAA